MKVQIKINPATILEVDGETPLDVFTKLAQLEEVFSIDRCGLCGSPVHHVAREASGFMFYELRCQNIKKDCGAALRFGQPKEGKGILFVQKKDKQGQWKPNGGWEIYRGPESQLSHGRNEYDIS